MPETWRAVGALIASSSSVGDRRVADDETSWLPGGSAAVSPMQSLLIAVSVRDWDTNMG